MSRKVQIVITLLILISFVQSHEYEIQLRIENSSGAPLQALVQVRTLDFDPVAEMTSCGSWTIRNTFNADIEVYGDGTVMTGSCITAVNRGNYYIRIGNKYFQLNMPSSSSPDTEITFRNGTITSHTGNSTVGSVMNWPTTPSASISGSSTVTLPYSAGDNTQYTWNANVSGGLTPYAYEWYYKTGASSFQYVGSGSSYTKTYTYIGDVTRTDRLKLIVDDSSNQSTTVYKDISIQYPPHPSINDHENQLSMEVVPEFLTINNFPNPFNPTTNINYNLPENSIVNIGVYDLNGQNVISWDLGDQSIGSHSIMWNGTNQNGEEVPAGVYLYHFKAIATNSDKVYSEKRKMIFMK